ncbi:MAG: aminotransferase class I/II-fold pyridoxal phosphate-dependent enzyme [Alphaproteobacteria bacterium]
MEKTDKRKPVPAQCLAEVKPYSLLIAPAPTDLKLDRNEGISPPLDILETLRRVDQDTLCRYRRPERLERLMAERWGVPPAQVLATAGADEAIDRACRVYVQPDREVIVPVPTFEMCITFAKLVGGRIKTVPWPEGAFPVEAVIAEVNERTGMIVLISPNNPTGLPATAADLEKLAAAAPHALILVDLAYAPFADIDLTPTVLRLPNALAVHTLSKGWGLAGLRVGFAAGTAEVVAHLRTAGGPYPISNLSLLLAEKWLTDGREQVEANIAVIRREREMLARLLDELGAATLPPQGNFVFARFGDELWVRDALAGLGIAVRYVQAEPHFAAGLRITCPGDEQVYARLEHALRTVRQPQALLFDMDGVLADVSQSYRAAIAATAESYGVSVTTDEISAAKAEAGANDDWLVTQRLLARHGVEADLAEVTARFEKLYQGTPEQAGLREKETLLIDHDLLRRLAERIPLGVVTGRPRADAERF